jgi:DNA polymerase elongation subunit (family B)
MSFRNVYYDKKNNQIHLWETVKGERLYSIHDWIPYVYVPTDKNTNIKSINDNNVVKKSFRNYFEYNQYQKEHTNIYENKVMPEIQYLAERYYNMPDDELETPELKIFSLDIEVHVEDGSFASPEEAKCPIVLVSLYDMMINEVTIFGIKEYNNPGTNEKYHYYLCNDEKDLLKQLMNFIYKETPDVITGWNIIPSAKMQISGFDLPYIINRCKRIFGENTDIYKYMSPIKEVRSWTNKTGDLNIDIAGVSIIDYMATYKWYTRNNPESYSLDYISKLELGKGKEDYSEYGNLRRLYHENWDLYVDYNIKDTKRVIELEQKLSYINLIQSLSLITKCPMKLYQAMTSLLEGKMLTYYRRNNMCAPFFTGGTQTGYPAAFVKEPQKGLHKWVASIDIASSYPTAIITLNMSPETYIGMIIGISEDRIIEYVSKKNFPEFELLNIVNMKTTKFRDEKLKKFNLMLSKGLISVAPCGTCFKTKPEGVVAHVERSMFLDRKSIKKRMRDEKDKKEIARLNTFQNALKILLNSFYGIMAVPYSRYFNTHIAEAITACGRHTVKQGEKFVNEILNEPEKSNELLNIIEEINKIE